MNSNSIVVQPFANKKSVKPSKVILFLGVFILTLVSHTIYAWAIGLLLIIVFLVVEKVPLKKQALIESLAFFMLLLISVIRFVTSIVNKTLPYFQNAFWGNTSLYVLCISAWLILRSIMLGNKKRELISLIAPILKVHIAIFYLQFFLYLITGYYLDLVEPFTGGASRYANLYTGPKPEIGSFRPTGFFVEPSTYFGAVLMLASLLLFFDGFRKHKKLFLLAILSMYLSFSTAAAIITTIFIIYILWTGKFGKRLYTYIVLIAIIIGVSAGSSIYSFYQSQSSRFDKTSGLRYGLITAVLNRDPSEVIMAKGAYAVDDNLAFSSTTAFGNSSIASFNDSGLLIYLWLIFGYLGCFYFLLLSRWQYKCGKKNLILFILISLTKISPFTPLFILYFAFSSYKSAKLEYTPSTNRNVNLK